MEMDEMIARSAKGIVAGLAVAFGAPFLMGLVAIMLVPGLVVDRAMIIAAIMSPLLGGMACAGVAGYAYLVHGLGIGVAMMTIDALFMRVQPTWVHLGISIVALIGGAIAARTSRQRS